MVHTISTDFPLQMTRTVIVSRESVSQRGGTMGDRNEHKPGRNFQLTS